MPKMFSDIEYEILRVLIRNGSAFATEIVQSSDRIKTGSVYVYLGRLKQKKWISAREDGVTAAGTAKKRYRITGSGVFQYRLYEGAREWAL